MRTLTTFYTDPTGTPQEPRPDNGGPDTPVVQNGTDVPIPLVVSVRFEKRSTLYRMLDFATDRLNRCERLGDTAGAELADRRHAIIFDEIDRRDAIAAERERRRQARMQTAAVIFRETGLVRS